jgi:hypothetical protein
VKFVSVCWSATWSQRTPRRTGSEKESTEDILPSPSSAPSAVVLVRLLAWDNRFCGKLDTLLINELPSRISTSTTERRGHDRGLTGTI